MYLILLIIGSLFSTNTCKCDNAKGKQKFNEFMELVELRVNDHKVAPNLSNAVLQLGLVTNIESESDATTLGLLNPTLNDYNKWKSWYEANQNKLCWNNRKEKLWLNE